ncbi:PREDICTED: uncharacterized protein LOC104587886 isoform X1 [Nelumbo nucifera]|uniref:Calcineurin-like phosphoesterase domain-containing protein n=2 Tax=Nelumbo nucifera TaxID=4432 RepID=A0A822ZZV9_NELNU|nr:PREDICTED: uncharacterized protein LOC104587886 isoform X1 [Nelumbo nucifera]DAD48629.1 TPA_asm: hypothetical protein HUJ06_018566 [Nelumbo nucifera]
MGEQGRPTEPEISTNERIVCCIGDLHGHISKLQKLWSNLETVISPPSFQTALIIFLGDYCDKGPDTRSVIDFLISLPSRYPKQTHVFLSGNHDLGFAAFIGVLPPPPDGSTFAETWKGSEQYGEKVGWYKGAGYENMHLQGRLWGGPVDSNAASTFQSYGIPYGSTDLVKAVPEEHKKFLADLVWVHEEDDVCIETSEGRKHYKLIAVHAGLEKTKGVQEQLKLLRARDTSQPMIVALTGRSNVLDIPQELVDCPTPTMLVSGHHGKLELNGLRLIIDESGGKERKPLAAVVLPSMMVVRDIW